MLLHTLLSDFDPRINLKSIPNAEITGLAEDSRIVQPGDLFIARTGTKTEGTKFIGQAIERGAAALVSSAKIDDCPIPQITIENPAAAIAPLAQIFFNHPSRQLRIVGITGTNGKTTATYLIRHILAKANIPCGLIGTVETDDGRSRTESSMTTPGPIELAKLFAKMRDNRLRACAMETSSHALHQGRCAAIRFAGAAFTNLTRDHLDYHADMQSYAAAKAILFESLDEDAIAVVNAEDPWSDRMIIGCRARVVRFGFSANADYRARDFAMTSQGSKFILHTPDGSAEVSLAMIGRHNIANALTAAAILCETFHLSVHTVAAALADAHGAPGRLQAIRRGQPFAVLVDYAHTDDALQKVLAALRPLTRGKLRVLFGCGGDRDRKKRPLMAKAAEDLADCIYVTSDNPRTEDPASIVDQIVAGFSSTIRKPLTIELDRRAAIARIVGDAEKSDVLLLAGKGHENYQIVGQTKHHFDDVEEVEAALEKVGRL